MSVAPNTGIETTVRSGDSVSMGFCETYEYNHRTRIAAQRARRAVQRGQIMPTIEARQESPETQQRRQVQYLCDQVQLAVAERKPQHIIDALLDDLSTVSGRPRMTV